MSIKYLFPKENLMAQKSPLNTSLDIVTMMSLRHCA